MAMTLLFTAAGPIFADYSDKISIPFAPVFTVYCIVAFIIMVIDHKKMEFKATASAILMSVCLQYGFSCVVYLRDVYTLDAAFKNKQAYGFFFLLFAFFCSWLTDAMAFFAGSLFGKHKMCPKISPNKTIEGAVGGVVCNTALTLVMLAIFRHFFAIEVGYVFTGIVTVILSVVSIFGDLAASVVKRQNKIKDFGNLLPGTGGVMDRFDSSLFVIPLLYCIVNILITNDLTHFILY